MQSLARPPRRSPAMGSLAFFIDRHPAEEDFRAAVLAGLAETPKSIPAKFFYDAAGSALFEQICETPEYYVTRTELALLASRGREVAQRVGTHAVIVEYGSGSGRKIRALLDALSDPAAYVALDISRQHLLAEAESVAADYPNLEVGAICADFVRELPTFELEHDGHGRRVGFFPGSTVGNLSPVEARRFLTRVHDHLGPGGALLIGVDLQKDSRKLERAYNDSTGVTAAFNKNILVRMQRELGADIEVDAFRHDAFYNAAAGRVEMHLTARRALTIGIDDQRIAFAEGERIHTENSYKYTTASFRALAAETGFQRGETWTDEHDLFSLHLLEGGY